MVTCSPYPDISQKRTTVILLIYSSCFVYNSTASTLTMQPWVEHKSSLGTGPCVDGSAMNVLDQDNNTCITVPNENCNFVATQFAIQQNSTYEGFVYGQYLSCEQPGLTIATRGNCSPNYPYTHCPITREERSPNDFIRCEFTCQCNGTSDQLRLQVSNKPWLPDIRPVSLCSIDIM